jgi:anti-sigma regulatory factor (Ser/Thr protein kinase)
VAAESPAVVPEPSGVEITPLAELDPSSTALEPELASELARRADQVVLDAVARESPVAEPRDTNPPGVCTRTFPAVAVSVADARNFAAQALTEVRADLLDDIRLMVSELASNAVEHAMTSFHLTIHHSRREIRVEVTDSGSGTPAMRSTGPDAVKGRGLQIVDMVSTQWGVEQEPDSAKTVWFSLELAPTAGPTPPA